jgi:CheY-like chemotaxis protein
MIELMSTDLSVTDVQFRTLVTGRRHPSDAAPGNGRRLRHFLESGDPDVTADRVSVLLVDDHALVRAGLASLLEASGSVRVVGQCADGSKAAEAVTRLEPDVVLMDLSMPGMDGIAATRAVLAQRPEHPL